MGSHGVPEGLRSLQEGHIPSYMFPESAAIAIARAARHGRGLRRREGKPVRFDNVDRARGDRAIAAARSHELPGDSGNAIWLQPAEVRELLGAYGIKMPEVSVATSAEQAAQYAKRAGFPVAIKLASKTITHKSDVGGVVLDVRTQDEVRKAFADIGQRLDAIGRAEEMDGVVIQSMVREGIEAIIGVTRDPSFGPLIMFGLGGVYVEILRDVAFRIHPLTDVDAEELVRQVKSFQLLEGYRGAPPGDIAAVERALLRVSQLLDDHPEIIEMDLNPIKALPPGKGCLVVDARVSIQREP